MFCGILSDWDKVKQNLWSIELDQEILLRGCKGFWLRVRLTE